jgi:hypothetical protein
MVSDDLATLEAFVAGFENHSLDTASWTHQAHLTVACFYVTRYGADDALTRLRFGIPRLNEAHGGVNTDTSGYHDTITVAYVKLIDQFLSTMRGDTPLPERVHRLLNSPVAERDVLQHYYSKEHLFSVAARRGWIEPDLRPLEAPLPQTPPPQTVVAGDRGDAPR